MKSGKYLNKHTGYLALAIMGLSSAPIAYLAGWLNHINQIHVAIAQLNSERQSLLSSHRRAPQSAKGVLPSRLGQVQATVGSHWVTLSWAPVAHATGYQIYRANLGQTFLQAKQVGTVQQSGGELSYRDTNVQANTHYQYWVIGKNRTGQGPAGLPTVAHTFLSWGSIQNRYSPAVVRVVVEKVSTGFLGWQRPRVVQEKSGTAWFANSHTVVTCDHVVLHATGHSSHWYHKTQWVIKVEEPNGQQQSARVSAVSHRHDLALLQVSPTKITPPSLAKGVSAGQPMAVIGYGTQSRTSLAAGQIINPAVTIWATGLGKLSPMIQTSAVTRAGDSGAPVFNHYGQVIGVQESGNQSASDVVPVQYVQSLLAGS